jgi:hypothetical protein
VATGISIPSRDAIAAARSAVRAPAHFEVLADAIAAARIEAIGRTALERLAQERIAEAVAAVGRATIDVASVPVLPEVRVTETVAAEPVVPAILRARVVLARSAATVAATERRATRACATDPTLAAASTAPDPAHTVVAGEVIPAAARRERSEGEGRDHDAVPEGGDE